MAPYGHYMDDAWHLMDIMDVLWTVMLVYSEDTNCH
ncbi:hypothetical protein SAMN06265222_113142 [Neorhodopirellula lusitana]|uniref:Uncharacterized protein n=1 Tax=Neorhodopirellula lusitana TaxID=445327 RepID=A0ABY1QKV4_9BACT|nr:hypothetical protein SAMN06265222_113142 [Neorhodopirellula lusitana]